MARLSALADWIEGEDPSGVVVPLVRAFLRDVKEVGLAAGELVAASSDAPELEASVHALALAIGLWRTNLLEHVDDLALSNYRSFSGWSSLPEYSATYTLALVKPAIAEAEAWAIAAGSARPAQSSRLAPLVRAVGLSVARLNATLRAAILGSACAECEDEGPLHLPSGLVATAW